MKKIKFILALMGCSLVLLACGKRAPKLSASLEAIQEILPKITVQLNAIQELETSLQTEWEQELTTNSDMSQYAEGNGKVFENIKNRQEIMAGFKKEVHLLEHENTTLIKNMDKDHPLAEIQIITNTLEQIIDASNEYIRLAEPQLQQETDFFKSLGTTSLNYDALNNKIIAINDAAMERQDCVEQINEQLMTIDKPIRIAKARLTSSQNE
ncbi:Putative cell-wall binding lipoprotein [Granulicatella balaenopterae]|uniref:Putative cell-wall binding lipoprotein n=1 Tax=Granulicatella balaenopterae TaxID=137733 RepID=A0A1H9K0J8_9LACT|nr:YkyA family protein [Granulicatella balaenopterae]SEQ92614.1 Putative cell-wall binding lipoprotein [Granulicatella balaenopterae]